MEVEEVFTLQLQNYCLLKDACTIWPWPQKRAVTTLGEDPLLQKYTDLEEMGKTDIYDILNEVETVVIGDFKNPRMKIRNTSNLS